MVAIHAPQIDPPGWGGPAGAPGVAPGPRDRRARAARRARMRRDVLRRRRRLTVLVVGAALAVVVVLAAGTALGALGGSVGSGTGARPVAAVSPQELAPDGTYVVQPGDTLWDIARRLAAGDDPRPLVEELRQRRGGVELRVGDRIDLADLLG